MSDTQTDFIMDVERLRREARKEIENGAVTPEYRANRDTVLKLLDSALATEWVCVLRYTQHAIAATGITSEAVAAEFAEHADDEREHARRLAERIMQLGGTPNLDPSSAATRSQTEYRQADDLVTMIRENLIAERIVIEGYGEMIRYVGDKDPTTRRLLEWILGEEEEHADALSDLLTTDFGKPMTEQRKH